MDADETLNYGAAIARHDHDWTLTFGVSYDVIGDDTSVFVRFVPRVPGLGYRPLREVDPFFGSRSRIGM